MVYTAAATAAGLTPSATTADKRQCIVPPRTIGIHIPTNCIIVSAAFRCVICILYFLFWQVSYSYIRQDDTAAAAVYEVYLI